MKKLIVGLMLLCPLMALGQVKASARAFPLTVHVVSSRIEPVSKNSTNAVRSVGLVNLLGVTIGGKKYLLAVLVYSGFWEGVRAVLLEPGDYPAYVEEDKTPNPGQVQRTYELRLANGKAVEAYLWGIGG